MNQSKRDSVNKALREKYPELKTIDPEVDFTVNVTPLMPILENLGVGVCVKRATGWDRWEARTETRQNVLAYGDTLAATVCCLLLEVKCT